jgi:hypothetical protein
MLKAIPVIAVSAPATVMGKDRAPPLPQRCEPPALGRDRLAVLCALDGAATQRIHVKVHLTGSHDDTTATLEVAIGGAPVACDAGSKTSTEFEDGDVTLDCLLTASVKPGTVSNLNVSARWFHAQYVNFEVNWRFE